MDTFSKTALYSGWTDLPPLVAQAVALANNLGFISCCMPEQGSCCERWRGAVRAASSAKPARDAAQDWPGWRAPSARRPGSSASKSMLRGPQPARRSLLLPNGDWRLIAAYGPFDLLVLDSGGTGKRADDAPAEPAELLKPAGTLVLDDLHPPLEFWPEKAVRRWRGRNRPIPSPERS